MTSLIVVHPTFEAHWPFVADHFYHTWRGQDETQLLRLSKDDERSLGEVVPDPATVTRLVCLGVPVTAQCLERFTNLREAVLRNAYAAIPLDEVSQRILESRSVHLYDHPREGYWPESTNV